MTKDEKIQLAGLLTWRKGVVPILKTVPAVLREVEALRKEVAALRGKIAVTSTSLGSMPKKEARLPFAAICEDIEERFDEVFRAALPDDDNVEEWTATDIAKRLKLTYSAGIMGRALRAFEVLQVVQRRKGKTVRLYRVVQKQPEV